MTPRNGRYAVSINADDDDDQIQITWEQVGWVYVPEIAPNSQSSAGWWSVQPPPTSAPFYYYKKLEDN